MHKPKKRSSQSAQKSVDWVEYVESLPQLVIPIGRRFQVNVPEWTGPSNLKGDLGSSKWLGTRIWPLGKKDKKKTKGVGKIGNGKPDSCSCPSPSSQQCINRHISEERSRLQSDLGPAYQIWKFDMMGEEVAKLWSSRQRRKFDLLVRKNPLSEGKTFLKPAMSCFVSKSRDDIVSYYLNVYVPKRIGIATRSGCQVLDSDDDEVQETTPTKANANAKNSLKRTRSPNSNNDSPIKPHYLTGRR